MLCAPTHKSVAEWLPSRRPAVAVVWLVYRSEHPVRVEGPSRPRDVIWAAGRAQAQARGCGEAAELGSERGARS
jgi:hypothetical protein